MPPSLTTRPHLSISRTMKSPNSAGAHAHGVGAFGRELLLHVGRMWIAAISLCSLLDDGGRRAGRRHHADPVGAS